MLSVFICEDDFAQRLRMELLVNDYIAHKDCAMKLALSTGNPTVLLEYLEEHPPSNALYILDVNLRHSMNGIALASEIRKRDVLGFILFVTTHAELAHLTFRYRIEALDYIIKDKDNIPKSVKECLSLAYERYQNVKSETEYFQLSSADGYQNIPVDDALFFETDQRSHRLILHLKSGRLELRSTLNEVEELHPAFFRCHMAYVVNTKNIKSVNTAERTIVMVSGGKTLVSRRKLKDLLAIVQGSEEE